MEVIYPNSIQRVVLQAMQFATKCIILVPLSVCAQDNSVLGTAVSAVPQKVEELPGLDIKGTNPDSYVTLGRPEDNSKKFVLYNVGTGKFLNVGSYWGAHAALSMVPRVFWLQNRSDNEVESYPMFARYPESAKADAGSFAYQFFHMSEFSVGSREGNGRSYVKYNRLVVVSKGEETPVCEAGYEPKGATFEKKFTGFDFLDDESYIEAEIDIAGNNWKENSYQNILSVGTDISTWNKGVLDLHIYGYKEAGKNRLRVECLNTDWNESTHRFGGSANPIPVEGNIVTVRIYNNHIIVNGTNCIPGSSSIYRNLRTLVAQNSFLFSQGGSEESKSNSTCKSLARVAKESQGKDTTETVTFSPDADRTFVRQFPGHLVKFETEIDVTNCSGKNENIISIGSNTAVWYKDNSQNIHLYYTKSEKKLEVDAVSKDDPSGTKNKVLLTDIDGKVKVSLDATDGLKVNGQVIRGTDAQVVRYLLNDAHGFQVGSQEGNSRSNATYGAASVTYNTSEIVEAPTSLLQDGSFPVDAVALNFQNEEILKGEFDINGCTTQGEGIMQMTVNTTSDKAKYSLALTYLGSDGSHRYIQALYDERVTGKDGYARTVAVGMEGTFSLEVNSGGLLIDGQNVYPESDLMPVLAYDAVKAGDLIYFQVDSYGNYKLGEDGKLIVGNSTNGKCLRNALSGGHMYASDGLADDSHPLFISSSFRKRSDASKKEGSFLAWNPVAEDATKYGDVGVFADRSLSPKFESNDTQDEKNAKIDAAVCNSRWYFDEVSGHTTTTGEAEHIYKIYLQMTDQTVRELDGNRRPADRVVSGPQKFYLQADKDFVLGNSNEDYQNKVDEDQEDLTMVEALEAAPSDDKGYWKLVSIEDYYNLFEGVESDFASMLDLSYILADPDFTRENSNLYGWQMDETIHGTEKPTTYTDLDDSSVTYTYSVGQLRIGYDHYSKKSLDDADYTDEQGVRNISGPSKADASKYVDKTRGSDAYQAARNRENNHGRYMGVEVREDGYGRFYQEITVRSFGWYSLSCKGFSTAGAELFIQKGSDKEGTWVSKRLHELTASEWDFFRSTERKRWPYDCISDTVGMPMYNALVAMNDDNVLTDIKGDGTRENVSQRFDNQIVFYVDQKDVDASGHFTLRLGINIPEDDGFEIMSQNSDGFSADLDEELAKGYKWTVFDNFHLYFGGNAPDPHLVLDEDSTSLDYLDQSIHRFEERPMHLHRTFTSGKWNTLILPVSLGKADFCQLFGETARLAKLDHLTATTVEFMSETEADSVFLKAYQPYIIMVDAQHTKGRGEAWEGSLYACPDNGSVPSSTSTKIPVKAEAGNFYLERATLATNSVDATTGQRRYNFKEDGTGGYLYAYKDATLAEGGGNTPLRAYGTLCKTYGTDSEGKNAILDGRPMLQGGYVMAGGYMRLIQNQYGTKGFRCWFMPESTSTETADMSAVKVVVDGEQTATGIGDLVDADGGVFIGQYADGVYSLSGQKVRQSNSLDGLPSGIYIVNGVKYIVK